MMGGNSNESPKAQPFGIQDQMTSNQQQAVPVALIAGTRKIAIKWLTPIYNIRSAPAPSRTTSKK
jgi:hypothetical protein